MSKRFMTAVAGRLHELCEKAESVELAIPLKSGVMVSRSPLFRRGVKVPIEKRKIEVYKPRRELTPAQIKKDAATGDDPQLIYRVTGRKQNQVDGIYTPRTNAAGEKMKNIADGVAIRRAFLGRKGDRLDRRGITSRTAASAYDHASISTGALEKHYGTMGYKRDRREMVGMISRARTPEDREIVRETLKSFVPMIRKPKNVAK